MNYLRSYWAGAPATVTPTKADPGTASTSAIDAPVPHLRFSCHLAIALSLKNPPRQYMTHRDVDLWLPAAVTLDEFLRKLDDDFGYRVGLVRYLDRRGREVTVESEDSWRTFKEMGVTDVYCWTEPKTLMEPESQQIDVRVAKRRKRRVAIDWRLLARGVTVTMFMCCGVVGWFIVTVAVVTFFTADAMVRLVLLLGRTWMMLAGRNLR